MTGKASEAEGEAHIGWGCGCAHIHAAGQKVFPCRSASHMMNHPMVYRCQRRSAISGLHDAVTSLTLMYFCYRWACCFRLVVVVVGGDVAVLV